MSTRVLCGIIKAPLFPVFRHGLQIRAGGIFFHHGLHGFSRIKSVSTLVLRGIIKAPLFPAFRHGLQIRASGLPITDYRLPVTTPSPHRPIAQSPHASRLTPHTARLTSSSSPDMEDEQAPPVDSSPAPEEPLLSLSQAEDHVP